MANNTTPVGYYDRFDRDVKKWKKLLFNPGKALQSAELNELQSIVQDEHAQLAKTIYNEGAIIEGMSFVVDLDAGTLSITAGKLYANGMVHDVQAGEVSILGTGEESIGVLIIPQVITEIEDSSLNDPAIGSENYGWAGSHRLTYEYQYTVNDPNAITIGVIESGQITQVFTQARPVSDKILKLLASRTFDESGSYTVFPFKVSVHWLSLADQPDLYDFKFRVKIDGGRAYVKGWKVENSIFTTIIDRTVKQEVELPAAPSVQEELDEAQGEANIFQATPYVYQMANTPIDSVSSVSAKVQTDDYPISRANADTDSLLKPDTYPLMTTVYTIDSVWKYVSGNSGPTTIYTAGVDYNKSGNFINWNTGGGIEPAVGETYYVKSTYQRQMVKAKRVLTLVSQESLVKGSGNGGLSTEIVNNGVGREIDRVVKIYQDETEFSDFTLSTYDGAITWTGADRPTNGETYNIDYYYWDHVIEGDYVSRDSFVDEDDKPLLYITPTLTAINGNAVDYTKQICFETASGILPKTGTDILFSYKYVLSRIDLIAIDYKGIISVIRGIPSTNPVVPVSSDDTLPIANIFLGPETSPEAIRITYFDNKNLTMTDLRSMLKTMKNMLYNDSVFQLHQNVMNKPLPTDKRGIIADNFRSHLLSDLGNADYSVTLDYLSGRAQLPQTMELFSLDANLTSTAVYRDGYYLKPYTHTMYIQQVYGTEPEIVNEYTVVPLTARARLFPYQDRWTDQETIRTVTQVPGTGEQQNVNFTINLSNGILSGTFRYSGLLSFFQALFANGFNSSPVIPQVNSPLRRMQPESWWSDFIEHTSSRWQNTWSLQSDVSTVRQDPGWTNVISNQVTTLLPLARQCPIYIVGEEFVPQEEVTCYFDGVKVPLSLSSYNGNTYRIPYETDIANNLPATTPLAKISGNVKFDSNGYATVSQPTSITSTLGTTPGTIKVGANGKWFGKITVPANTNAGTHEIKLEGSGFGQYSPTKISTEFTSQGYKTTIYENVTVRPSGRTVTRNIVANLDPTAQTFFTKESCYLTKLDVYFHTKPNQTVIADIREVANGVPTTKVLGTCTLGPDDCTESSNGSLATTFEFYAPVFVEANKEYAFVISTNDPLAKLWVAKMNGTDPVRGWVNSNPYTGVLLKSANASTWSPKQDTDVKFNLYRAKFSTDQAVINFEDITFQESKNRLEYYSQCIEPGNSSHARYQVSTDGVTWRDFTPPMELDLHSLASTVKTRILLLSDEYLSPIIPETISLAASRWELSGTYVCRLFELAHNDVAGSFDVWLDTLEPSGTSITVNVCYDGSLTNYVEVPHVVSDDVRINENGWYEKHYHLSAGADGLDLSNGEFPLNNNGYTTFHIKVDLTSDNHVVTPEIASFRASANDLPV